MHIARNNGQGPPKKELILTPNAGHFAFMTASDKFLGVLTTKVRPVAVAGGA